MNTPIRILFATAFLTLAGCASQPKSPDWVNGDSASYKSAQYLLGRGQASTQDDAKDRARADLAKIFQVAVVASSEDVQQFRTTADGGQYEGQSSRSISTRTEQIVSGIQIAEIWQDPESRTYYALATLPRLQTAASLRQQIGQLDDATGNYLNQSRSNTDLFLKIAAANNALASQRDRDVLQKSLQVVDITGRGIEPKWNAAKLKADLDALLKRVRIASKVTDDSMPGTAGIVSGALAQAGFMIETGQNPDFILQARMNLGDVSARDGWYWQRGTLEITLSEAATGRVRGTKRWDIKASATDRETAAKRALDQADAILKKELGPTLVGMAIATGTAN
ncbi:MAG TPA: LPP20 family lipoprotein [Gallionellaceae bacterium]